MNWTNLINFFNLDRQSPKDLQEFLESCEKRSNQHNYTSVTITTTSNQSEIEKSRQTLIRRISRFKQRLQFFLDKGVWKIRKEISFQDDDPELQKLLTSLSKEEITIESLKLKYYSSEELERLDEIVCVKKLVESVREKIRQELKLRTNKKEKRKFTFLLD